MSLAFEVPGRGPIELVHLVVDVNGTLTDRGAPVEGVIERIGAVRRHLDVHLVSADTFGTLEAVAADLQVAWKRVGSAREKGGYVEELGAGECAAIGNGANDAPMLELAAIGIAVVGPEGAAGEAVRAADVVCGSILVALDLLLDERALAATLRR